MLCFVFTIFVLDNFILSAHARHVVCPVVSRSYLCPPISEAYYLILLRFVLCPVLPVPAAHHSLSSDCLLGFDLCLTTGFCACTGFVYLVWTDVCRSSRLHSPVRRVLHSYSASSTGDLLTGPAAFLLFSKSSQMPFYAFLFVVYYI